MQKIEIKNTLIGVAHAGKILVDNTNFEKLDIEGRGIAVSAFTKTGGEISFKPNLDFLTNYKIISEKLLKGENAEIELAFNNIEKPAGFDAAVTAYHAAVSPLIGVLNALVPKYQWIETKPKSGTSTIAYRDNRINRGGYHISVEACKIIWDRASAWWSTNPKSNKGQPAQWYQDNVYSGSRYVTVNAKSITIGCQNITRWEVEQIAKHYNWDPVTPEG